MKRLENVSLIIVHYIDVKGMSRQRGIEKTMDYKETHGGRIENAVEYFLPFGDSSSGDARIEFHKITEIDEFTMEKLKELEQINLEVDDNTII